MTFLSVKTTARNEMVDVTALVQTEVRTAKVKSGIAICFVPHTTAAITINENSDPDVKRDILHKLAKEIPKEDNYHHMEGNSDSHVKASLVGSSVMLLVENNELVLGQWQGILFCEFDGPRHRKLIVKVAAFAKD